MQFYRFIQVESGIRERRKKKVRKGKGSARNFGEEKEKKERGKTAEWKEKKKPVIARATI